MNYRERIIQSEGRTFPGKTYTEVVLSPSYDEAKKHFLDPMMAIHKAHLIMLTEKRLISPEEGKRIAEAIRSLDLQSIRESDYSGEVEDLFFQVERELLNQAGDIAGNLHIARSRNDMGITMCRLTLRDKVQTAISSVLFLKEHLLEFANEHVETLMIGYTHTQQAQPTTLAHYIMAVVDSLSRDMRRLMSAYHQLNQSPMGAAAITTSGFNIDRERVMELLGFDGLIENSYDAIAGADYIAEVMTVTQITAISLGRFVQDLLLWSTQEFDVLRVSDPYVQTSSIMPQKRNPVSLEHSRALLSSCIGNTQTALTMIHNTPFGDINDTEDDMQPFAWRSLGLLDKVCRLLACVIGTAEVNKEKLRERAKGSFANITELADELVRTEAISFRKAHHIASRVVKNAISQGIAAHEVTLNLVNEAAQEVIGRPLLLDEAKLRQSLDPEYFVTVRSLPGGPNPDEMRRMIALRRNQQDEHQAWLKDAKEKSQQSQYHLDSVLEQWCEHNV
ncbi:argininosuccinate lyase [Paenibacillus radicis (ex Xue et al. 2023)]|uniref:Argininosuccinate lyase n=1 Tax=Paenibacillus radicis (ex Xue et al. 2023) TaxID=2972489 RepID=A0ABT1YNR7_9BACL|nr:argininosuccinate lyase [Paenibacillus radicis (ex Xue et al. 2023)]MCR8634834.1 argininosuccinate lyase [Paenibacillus radicis (ex Xue et al. 2023)]